MENKVDTKRLAVYLAFAFGIAWVVGLVIYLTGGLANSPVILPNMTLAFILVAVLYMGAPALAHVLTRLVTREGWSNVYLRPNFKRGWKFWLAAWFAPGLLAVAGTALYFLLFPAKFDSNLTQVTQMLAQYGVTGMNPWLYLAGNFLQGMLIAPLVNGLFTFGEEFGWRAYLLPKLMPLGARKATLISGVIWGLWHAPVIAMGHNYGLDYPGAPWTGILMMTLFTTVAGTFLNWAAYKGGSVWPAVIGHASMNGLAAIGIFMVITPMQTLLGPAPTGIVSMIPWILMAAVLFFVPWVRKSQAAETVQ